MPVHLPETLLRWYVWQCRKHSDTGAEQLLELARCAMLAPQGKDAAPFLEIGTRSGGSALLMLKVLRRIYGKLEIRPPQVFTVDPYGSRPYEGEPHIYDERHYGRMKKNLAPYTNHIHYMMDSELFLHEVDSLYLWTDGTKRGFDKFSLVYLDGSHDPVIVWSEIQATLPRIVAGGFLIVDDTNWFDSAVRKKLDAAVQGWDVTMRHNGKQSILRVNTGVTLLSSGS